MPVARLQFGYMDSKTAMIDYRYRETGNSTVLKDVDRFAMQN